MKTAENRGTNSTVSRFSGDYIREIVDLFPERTQNILRDRYNLDGTYARGKTLDAIGKQYNITRERVRQIIQFAMKTVRDKGVKSVDSAIEAVDVHLVEKGGIYAKKALLEDLRVSQPDDVGAIDFLLDMTPSFRLYTPDRYVTHAVARRDFDVTELRKVIVDVEAFLNEAKKPQSLDFLWRKWQEKNNTTLNTRYFEAFLVSSANIDKNILNEWGMNTWGDVCPKSSGQRALLILRRYNRPMHFSEIAQKINELGIAPRKANPQTVHNELIKSPKFTLIGRGVYGLSEWK